MAPKKLLQGRFARFMVDECGAVTVDWVVITAALVGLALATSLAVSEGVDDLSGDLAATASDFEIETTFD